MEAWLRDVRYGVRALAHRPVITLVAMVSLALGVGANGTVFSLVNGLLLRPPAGVERPGELVRIYELRKSFDWPLGVSVPDFEDVRDGTGELVSSIGGHAFNVFGVSLDGGAPRPVAGVVVSGDYFATLGAKPAMGALPGRAEDDRRAAVMVASHDFWRDQLGSDPAAIGRALTVDGSSLTLVAVTEPGFHGNETLFVPELWVPTQSLDHIRTTLDARGSTPLRVTARLRPGVSLEQLDQRLGALGVALAEEHPESNEHVAFHAMADSEARIEAGLGGPLRVIATLLLVLVAFVLLIACANVANLLLARAAGRRRELALRVAVGASRGALLRQLLVESLLLAAGGGVLGTLLAIAVARVMTTGEVPAQIPIRLDVSPDLRVYLYSGAVALIAGLAFGLLPALRSSRTDPVDGLKVSLVGATGGGRRHRSASALVVAQVALSLVLLVGGGLFQRSLRQAQAVDLGFDPAGLVALSVDLSMIGRSADESRVFFDDAAREMEQLAGVEDVTWASWPPMDWNADGTTLGVGRDLGEDLGDELMTLGSWVGAGYFEAMDTRIVDGRGIEEGDDQRGRPVIVVNQAFVDRVWPGERAVGKTLRVDGRDGRAVEVVGVVETGKYRLHGESPRPYFFLPLEQSERSAATLLVRSRRPPAALLQEMQQRVARLEPDLAVQNAGLFEAAVQGRALGPIQVVAMLAGSFGLIGLVLATTGLYAVIAFSVAQRVREIGVRMALGARPPQVLRAILGEGLRLAALGVAIGLGVSLAVTRLMDTFLVGVSGSDPATFVSVVTLLAAVAVVASLVPALRAARVDPAHTLRAD